MQDSGETVKVDVVEVSTAVRDDKVTKSPKLSPSSNLFSNVNIMEDILIQKLPEFDEISEDSDENDSFKEDGFIMRRKKIKKRSKSSLVESLNMKSLDNTLPNSECDSFKTKLE